jgi:zinc transporter, ZIP family
MESRPLTGRRERAAGLRRSAGDGAGDRSRRAAVRPRRPEHAWLGVANALASGFMLGASVGLLHEGVGRGSGRAAAGALGGAVFIALAGRFFMRHELPVGVLRGTDARRALLVVGVMTVHSFTEGVGVGVAFGGGETLGVLIAVAIAVHNIPEGLAVSLVLVPRGTPVAGAAGWSIVSSLPQPLMAVPAFVFVEIFQPLLSVGLGFAAGAMLWLVARELLPEALREARAATVVATAATSAVAMIAFQLALL